MKRCLQTLLVAVCFLFTTSVVGWAAQFIPLGFWGIFGVASGILAAGLILSLTCRRKKSVKLVSIAVNAVAMGFYLRSWYINRGFDNALWLMLCVSLLAAAYLFIFILPLYIDAINRHYGWYLLVFTVLSVAGYVCLVVLTKTTWVSTLGYYGLLQLGFIMTMSMDGSNRLKLYNSWQVASYTVAVCAVIILISVLGGDAAGDFLDGFSGGGGGKSSGISSPRQPKPKNEAESFIKPM